MSAELRGTRCYVAWDVNLNDLFCGVALADVPLVAPRDFARLLELLDHLDILMLLLEAQELQELLDLLDLLEVLDLQDHLDFYI